MPSAREYVLYAVKRALDRAKRSVEAVRALEPIAREPLQPYAVAWAASWLSGDLRVSPDTTAPPPLPVPGDGEHLPAGPNSPFWLADGRVVDRVRVNSLANETPARSLIVGASWLDLQSRLEAIAAIGGRKVSRLSLDLESALKLQNLWGCPLPCSAGKVIAHQDDKLPGFSNVMTRVDISATALRASDSINVYLARDWRDALMCAALDCTDLAGNLLGIPSCCRKWFARIWPDCLRDCNGDVAFVSLAIAPGQKELVIPWQSNPYAVYFGGSFLSHFPCHVHCEASKLLVDDLADWTARTAPAIHAEIGRIQKQPFWVSKGRETSLTARQEAGWTKVVPV